MDLLVDREFRSLIPSLEAPELKLLEESILEDGVRDALILWNGYIIDGHNRYDIIVKRNIKDYRVIYKKFPDREAAKIWIMKNQIARRNVAPYLRAEYIFRVAEWEERRKQAKQHQSLGQPLDEIIQTPIDTQKDLADKLGIGRQTAGRIFQIHTKATEEQKAKLRTGEASTNEVYKDIKRHEQEEKWNTQRQEIIARARESTDPHIKILLGDFREHCLNIKDNSIDHIFCDPPYAEEYKELWEDLAEIASRILKPGGFCITYSGNFNLPKFLNCLSEFLTYYWTFIILHTGSWQRIEARSLTTGFKPILVFAKEPVKQRLNFTWDVVKGSGRAKNHHKWEQSQGEAEEILNRLTNESELILDPFAGSGTIAMACKSTKRRNISIEINRDNYDLILGRLNDGSKSVG